MSNKGLIITMIILLSIIVVGLIALLVFMINGGSFAFGANSNKKSEEIVFDESYLANEINDIEILSQAGDISFEESENEEIRVVVCGRNNGKLKVNLNSNKLKIDYPQNIGFNFFGFNSSRNNITVYIPKDYDKQIKVDADYGNIEMLSLENASANIKADCGNVILSAIKDIEAKVDCGNIEIGKVLNELDIKADCGDVKIDELELAENSSIKVDLGNVKIGKTNELYIDASVDLGDAKVNTTNRYANVTLKIDVDCGNIKVEN